ncbi:hypothetical protein V6N13_140141 [Hibiscus sabdariffa]|uniref:Uncharacterized protein n=2 Tax=Hibiscus sabdariffa TaxID=183260 RepID=A0ABR2QB12_9ROSI
MADYCAQSMNPPRQASKSKPPPSYQLCNLVATLTGFVFPLVLPFCSQRGYIQPQLPFTPFAVLLGPYILLLSVQVLTEMLTWHWQSPVWLATPVVYEAYRVLQPVRGLRLDALYQGPGLLVGSDSWCATHEGCLVCWCYRWSSSTPVFYR